MNRSTPGLPVHHKFPLSDSGNDHGARPPGILTPMNFLEHCLWSKQDRPGITETMWLKHVVIPGGPSDKEHTYQCRRHNRHRFDLWVGKILCSRKWQPLQCSCLENPRDRGAWWATIHRVAKSGTWLKQLSMHACIGNIYITTCFWFCFSEEPKFSLQSKRNSNIKSRNISENSVILTFFF